MTTYQCPGCGHYHVDACPIRVARVPGFPSTGTVPCGCDGGETSASRQHFIDTGRYLKTGASA